MWWWGPLLRMATLSCVRSLLLFFFAGFAGIVLLHEADRLPQGSAAGGRGRYGPRPVAKAAEGVGSGELP